MGTHWWFEGLQNKTSINLFRIALALILTGLRKAPKNVRGTEIPNQRQSKARRVVKGMAADEPAYHRNRLRVKNTTKIIPGTKNDVIRTLLFQRRPPITERDRESIYFFAKDLELTSLTLVHSC